MAFDPMNWTEEEERMVQGLLESHGWKDVMGPMMVHQRDQARAVLEMAREMRPEPKQSGDFWRGYISGLRFALSYWYERGKNRKDEAREQVKRAQEEAAEETDGVGSVYAAEATS